MNNPDERLYELEVGRCDDGEFLLSQGYDGNGVEIALRLHRCHFDLLAELSGFVSEDEAARRCERLTDRMNVMAALIHSQTDEGDPLRAAVAAIMPGEGRHITPTTAPNLSRTIRSTNEGQGHDQDIPA